jgi:predicted tellurium resistance membrane protein TerC
MTTLLDPETWLALLTLAALEIVLGVDNIIFLTIMAAKLPAHERQRARTLGLLGAMFTRIGLLLSLTWVMKLTAPLFAVAGNELSGRDLILILGGAFLIAKSTFELHDQIEGGGPEDDAENLARKAASFTMVVLQIAIIDIVFSLDSVITAVGMARDLWVMVVAIVLAVLVMMLFSGAVSHFVDQHPTVKVLALSFLILIGTALVGEGFEFHIPKGYLYFAMAFSVVVEMINMRVRRKVIQLPNRQ